MIYMEANHPKPSLSILRNFSKSRNTICNMIAWTTERELTGTGGSSFLYRKIAFVVFFLWICGRKTRKEKNEESDRLDNIQNQSRSPDRERALPAFALSRTVMPGISNFKQWKSKDLGQNARTQQFQRFEGYLPRLFPSVSVWFLKQSGLEKFKLSSQKRTFCTVHNRLGCSL